MKIAVKPGQVVLPLYLAAAVMVQTEMTVKNSVIVLLPAVVMVVALVKKERWLGMAGFALFGFFALPLIQLSSLLDPHAILEITFVVLPSILLLSQMLTVETEEMLPPLQLPSLLPVIFLVLVMGSVLYTMAWFTPFGPAIFYTSHGQVLMLSFLAIVLCTPFLLSSPQK